MYLLFTGPIAFIIDCEQKLHLEFGFASDPLFAKTGITFLVRILKLEHVMKPLNITRVQRHFECSTLPPVTLLWISHKLPPPLNECEVICLVFDDTSRLFSTICHRCVPLVEGACFVHQCSLNGKLFRWSILSRRSTKLAGTRFNRRGADEVQMVIFGQVLIILKWIFFNAMNQFTGQNIAL